MPRRRHRDTSSTAYAAWLRDSPVVDARILRHLRAQGEHGATDEELETSLRLKHQTLSANRSHLVDDNLIHDSGAQRITTSGRPATVWRYGPTPAPVVEGNGQIQLGLDP